MKKNILFAFAIALSACSAKRDATGPARSAASNGGVKYWITKGDKTALLEEQPAVLKFGTAQATNAIITVDDTQKFQTIDGFGYTLTGGSASLINALDEKAKDTLLQELFSTKKKQYWCKLSENQYRRFRSECRNLYLQ